MAELNIPEHLAKHDAEIAQLQHATSGWFAATRKEYEESRSLWRQTQVQLNENARLIGELTLKIADTNDTLRRYADESRERDRELGERISAMVSAIGELTGLVRGQQKA
jgi:C4-dicarboxylate-specific signal transduction histidine kinase